MSSNGRQERLEKLADAVTPEAIEWIAELRAYRTYQGEKPEYFKKARIALGVVSNAVRLAATVENARANTLLENKAARILTPGAGEQ